MVHGLYLIQALLSKEIVKDSHPLPTPITSKKRDVKLLDQPIHFTDEQTETSNVE